MLSQEFLQYFCKWCFAYDDGGLDCDGKKWRYKETAIAALIKAKNSHHKMIRADDWDEGDWESTIEDFCHTLMRNMLREYCATQGDGGCFCTDENIEQLARILKESVGIRDA